MKAEDFTRMIIDSYQVGFMEAVKAYEPSADLLRASEIKKWLKMMRVELKKFNVLCRDGLIKPVRKGTSRNSPIYYSKAEIKKALLTAGISMLHAKECFYGRIEE